MPFQPRYSNICWITVSTDSQHTKQRHLDCRGERGLWRDFGNLRSPFPTFHENRKGRSLSRTIKYPRVLTQTMSSLHALRYFIFAASLKVRLRMNKKAA